MSYKSISLAAQDPHLRLRIAACMAQEYNGPRHPLENTDQLMWNICSSPGWGEAYEYAISTEVDNPGDDPAVISDGMILAAVQAIVNPPPPPPPEQPVVPE